MILETFIIAQVFVGVICQNIEEATHKDEMMADRKRFIAQSRKQKLVMKKQSKDLNKLFAHQSDANLKMKAILARLAGTLRHEDLVPMTNILTNQTWLETFNISLDHHENALYRIQQCHFALANNLAEYGKH